MPFCDQSPRRRASTSRRQSMQDTILLPADGSICVQRRVWNDTVPPRCMDTNIAPSKSSRRQCSACRPCPSPGTATNDSEEALRRVQYCEEGHVVCPSDAESRVPWPVRAIKSHAQPSLSVLSFPQALATPLIHLKHTHPRHRPPKHIRLKYNAALDQAPCVPAP